VCERNRETETEEVRYFICAKFFCIFESNASHSDVVLISATLAETAIELPVVLSRVPRSRRHLVILPHLEPLRVEVLTQPLLLRESLPAVPGLGADREVDGAYEVGGDFSAVFAVVRAVSAHIVLGSEMEREDDKMAT